MSEHEGWEFTPEMGIWRHPEKTAQLLRRVLGERELIKVRCAHDFGKGTEFGFAWHVDAKKQLDIPARLWTMFQVAGYEWVQLPELRRENAAVRVCNCGESYTVWEAYGRCAEAQAHADEFPKHTATVECRPGRLVAMYGWSARNKDEVENAAMILREGVDMSTVRIEG